MRLQHLAMATDLGWVALSAILAVLVRDNFIPLHHHLNAVAVYTAIAVASSAIVFSIAGLHKRLWQYTSLHDVSRIIVSVTIALFLAVFVSFVGSRLEGVARSVPLIQWFILVTAMIGTRAALRMWEERRRHNNSPHPRASVEHVLIVGISHLTELFAQSVAQYASNRIDIVGILSEERQLRGRVLRFHKVLGAPEELPRVLAQLEVHGIALDRIVVMQPFDELSVPARDALLQVEKSSGVKVEWISELLGLTIGRDSDSAPTEISPRVASQRPISDTVSQGISSSYRPLKRAFDILGAVLLSVALLPLIVVVAVLVAIDVGFPVVFWQKRPGQFGHPFKLFKFCTMHPAHDGAGARIADEKRSSVVGRLLRRTRLDEIPQLYNVLIGEMSFIGPRPLLSPDQPTERSARLLVRPGLTGMAQVYGARDISPEDKNALDIWYVQHASLMVDVKILIRTPLVMLFGERVNRRVVCAARRGIERLMAKPTASGSLQVGAEQATADGEAARA
ncbi:MAG TPA: sugar transferase [Methyloceanibacter sp.]|nr:sugar transferase [Methyloceanibacter sp.]